MVALYKPLLLLTRWPATYESVLTSLMSVKECKQLIMACKQLIMAQFCSSCLEFLQCVMLVEHWSGAFQLQPGLDMKINLFLECSNQQLNTCKILTELNIVCT